MNNLIIKSNTKFMEEFQISTFCQSLGNISSICPDPDNEITILGNGYNNFTQISTDMLSDTGFSEEILPFHGSHFCIGKASDKRIILLYTRSEELYYVEEVSAGSKKFTKEMPLCMPLPSDIDYIYSTITQPLDTGFAFGIIAHCSSNNLFYLVYGFWQDQVPDLNQLTNGFVNPFGIFQGNTLANLRFTVWENTISDFYFSNGEWDNYTVSENISPILFTSAQVDEQHAYLMSYVKSGSGYKFIGFEQDSNTHIATVSVIDDTEELSSLQSCVFTNPYESDQQEIHVLALTSRNTLKHCRIIYQKEQSIYNYSTLNDLGFEQVESFSFVKNNSLNLNAYISFVDHKKVLRLSYSFLTSLWNEEEIMIPNETYVQSLPGYATELLFQDAQGIPYQNISLNLWTNDITRVKIGSTFHLLSLQNRLSLKTDNNGKIRVFQPTYELSSSAFILNVPSLMASQETYVLRPSDIVKNELENITSEQLLNARKSDGTYLLDEQHRNSSVAENLAKSIRQFTNVSTTMKNTSFNKNLYLCEENRLEDVSYIRCNSEPNGWKITLNQGDITYTDLSIEDTYSYFQGMQTGYDFSFKSFFGKIGDFVKEIGNKIVDSIVIVGQKVVNAIKVAAEFIVDGIKYVFNEVINIVEQALEFAQTIFQKVGVFFQDIFHWIGDIINWDTILRYKKAISYTLDQAFVYIDRSAATLSTTVTDKIREFQLKLHDYFSFLAERVSGESVGSILKKPVSNSELELQISNNFLMDRYMENMNSLELVDSFVWLDETIESINTTYDDLIRNSELMQSLKAFQDAKDYFSQISNDKKNIFGNLMAGILKTLEGVIQVSADITCNVIQLVFLGIRKILDSIHELITTKIRIPYLSDLYHWIAKDDLTFSDLISLILALPVSAYCRVIYHENLMPDDEALESFKKDVTIDNLLCMDNDLFKAVPQKSQDALNCISGISSLCFYCLTGLGDSASIPKSTQENQADSLQKFIADPLSIACCLTETIWQICCSPFWFSSRPKDVDIVCWSYCWLGLSLDYITTIATGAYPDFSNDLCRILTIIYGLGHLGESICVLVESDSGASGHLTNFIPSIVEISKLCFLKPVITFTEGVSACIGVGIDVLGASGICLAYSGIFGYEVE